MGAHFVDIKSFAACVAPIIHKHEVGCRRRIQCGVPLPVSESMDLWKVYRLENACGAMVASRHSCSISMLFWDEVMAFVRERGGF